MSLTILLGDYGAGKTATAKYLAKKTGGTYLDVDLLSQGGDGFDAITLIDKLRIILKQDGDYYMDGYPAGYGYGMVMPENLNTEIKYIACMPPPLVIQSRQLKKVGHTMTALPRTLDDIKRATHYAACVALTYDADPLFADTSRRPVTFWTKSNWIRRWIEINIYSALNNTGQYQDVELSDRTIVGLSKSYKTWDRLQALVDFKGKTVIDYGCNYGYFCFKAEEAGADRIIGVDESQSVLNLAISIGMTKKSQVKFKAIELKNYHPPDTDIVMALNVLHHLNYDGGVVDAMFKCAGMVILEMPAKDLPVIEVVARSHRFPKPVIASSHREDRCIVIYSKMKPAVLPKRFVYHPRRAALLKWLFHTASKFIPKTAFVRRIKRFVWVRLK